MARRSDPHYRHLATWEPASTGIRSDFGESLLTGLLIGLALVLADRCVFGEWAELPAIALLLVLPVLAVWIRTRTRGRVKRPELVATDDRPTDRLVMVNPRPPEEPERGDQDRGDFEAFVRGCAIDTSLRRWELMLGREGYERYRYVLP